MQFFTMRKRASHLALAIAMATGTAVVASAVFPTEAQAQRKKKNKGGDYSKEFIAAYQPVNEAVTPDGADVAAWKPQLLGLVAVASNDNEKMAAGGLIFNSGVKLNDRELQLSGMELMLASNKVPIESVGRYNFIAYQLANAAQQYPKARKYLQAAINANFTSEGISQADMQIAMAENFFASNELRPGLNFLKNAIASRKSRGEEVAEQWYRRGLTVAYNNEVLPEVYEFTSMWIADYPSPTNWRDSVNLVRNLNEFGPQQTLDLLRLSRRTGALADKQDYILYIESADARRLPKEVKDLIDQAYAEDAVSRDDIYVADALTTANGRIATDRADLPALEADASAPDAALRTVAAAGNAFYSYGEYAKAAKFYQKALGMPGVETGEVMTRLGMSQVALGDYDAARETLGKVQGPRAPIAMLWAAYASEKAGPAEDAPSLGDLMKAST